MEPVEVEDEEGGASEARPGEISGAQLQDVLDRHLVSPDNINWGDVTISPEQVLGAMENAAERSLLPYRLTREIMEALAVPFPTSAVSLKIQAQSKDKSKGMIVAFIDARDVMDRLDAVAGPDWSDAYQAAASGGVECSLTVCGVTRTDVGDDKNDNEPIKSGYSDAFKRAAVKFGIGRYLYSLPRVWTQLEGEGNFKRIPAQAEANIRQQIESFVTRWVAARAKVSGMNAVPGAPRASEQAMTEMAKTLATVGQAARAVQPMAGERAVAAAQRIEQSKEPAPKAGTLAAAGIRTQLADEVAEALAMEQAEEEGGMADQDGFEGQPEHTGPAAAAIREQTKHKPGDSLASFKVGSRWIGVWDAWVKQLITNYPEYAKVGKPTEVDSMHLLGAMKAEGYATITDENFKEALEKVVLRVKAKRAAAETAPAAPAARKTAAKTPARSATPAAAVAQEKLKKAGF